MAVRFDGVGDQFTRSTDLLNYNAAYTIMFWAVISVADSSNRTFILIQDGATNGYDWLRTQTDGVTLQLRTFSGGGGTNANGSVLTVGTWYHFTMVRNSLTSVQMYLNGVLDGTNARDVTGRSAVGLMEFAGLGGAQRLNGKVAAIKAWSTNLTEAEIKNEMYSILPRRTANLYGWWPVFPGSPERIRDYSGNGRNWTEAGTLTDEDGPPVAWGLYAPPSPVFVAAGGSDETVILNTLTLASSIQALAVVPGSISSLMDTLTLVSTLEDFTVSPGVISTLLDSLSAGFAVDDLLVSSVISLALDELVLSSSVQDLVVAPGQVSTIFNTLTLASLVEDLTVASGSVSLSMDTLTLISSIQDLTIQTLTNIPLDTLSLTGSIEDLTISSSISILLDELSLLSNIQDLTVVPGAASIIFDTLSLISSIQDLDVVTGGFFQSQVSASDHDAHQLGIGVSAVIDSTTSTLSASSHWWACIIGDISIPKGSTILSATLEIYSDTLASDNARTNIHCQLGNADPFTTAANDISNRTRTTAFVNWNSLDIGTGWKSAPDLATVLQEVIDDASWVELNDVAFIFDWTTTGTGLTIRNYDYPGNIYGAKLTVTYVPPISLSTLVLISTLQSLTVVPGTVSIAFDTLSLASSLEDLTVSSTVTLLLNALSLVSSPEDIAVSAGPVSILLDSLSLASSVEDLSVLVGLFVDLDSLTLSGTLEDLTVVPGAVSALLNALSIVSSVEDLQVVSDNLVSLDSLSLASSIEDLIVTQGSVSLLLNTLSLSSQVEDLTISPGAIAVLMSALNLISSVEDLQITSGSSVGLGSLSLASSLEDLTVVPGQTSLLLDTLNLGSQIEDLIVTSGAISISLSTLSLSSSIQDLIITSTVLTLLDTLTLSSSLEDLSINPGGVSITLDELTLASSILDLSLGAQGAILQALFKGMFKGMKV